MTTKSQEHSVLTTSCRLYFPCSQSNFPNIASHPPPIKDNCKEPYLSYCHSLNTLQVFPFLRFYLFFSPYQEASLTSHLIGIPFIPQNLLQPKGHSLQEIFPNTTAGSTPPPSNCYSLVFVFPIICNNLFIVQLHKDTENHINQMFGLIE